MDVHIPSKLLMPNAVTHHPAGNPEASLCCQLNREEDDGLEGVMAIEPGCESTGSGKAADPGMAARTAMTPWLGM